MKNALLNKLIAALLAVLVANLGVFASIGTTSDEKATEKVKQTIAKVGTGPDARIEVELKDGTKVRGYVSEINNDSFVVKNSKDGTSTVVPYPQVKTGHSKRHWIFFGAGLAAIIIIGVVVASKAK